MKMHKKLILTAATVLVVGGTVTGVALAMRDEELISPSVTNSNQPERANQENIESLDPTDPVTTISPQMPQNQEPQQEDQQTEPATVVAYEQVPQEGEGNIDCKLLYSDGSTYQWHWKFVNEQGSWITDSSGNNGRWLPVSNTVGNCNDNLIGQQKLP